MRKEVALITGASSGLGAELVRQLVGFKTIILVSRNQAKLEAAADQLDKDIEAVIYPCDLSQKAEIKELAAFVQARYTRVDLLINNAGFGEFKSLGDFELSEIEQMFKVNVLGLIYLTRLLATQMIQHQSGHIINIASMAGKIASSKSTIYSATKYAVLGFSNALRLELQPFGVFVTTVNPGPINTPFFQSTPESKAYLKRVAAFTLEPEYVASKIIAAIGKNKREINLPHYLESVTRLYTLMPKLGDYLALKMFDFK
ncbi:MAG: SDR family oxidoreductase [Streptococcaceae bacterium]|jgi:short-subunit dehydrogenase|nr:SDR family oxidoreductase [Streptococcaceae bacterium]